MTTCTEDKVASSSEAQLLSPGSHRDRNRSILEIGNESRLMLKSIQVISSHEAIKEEPSKEEEKVEWQAEAGIEQPKNKPKYSMTQKDQISSQLRLLDKNKVERQLHVFARGNSFDMTSKKSKGSSLESENNNSLLNQAIIHGTSNYSLLMPSGSKGQSQNNSNMSEISLIQTNGKEMVPRPK